MDKMKILNNLNELAKRGVGGEKENAEKLLEKLLKKYNMTIEEIEQDVPKTRYIVRSENKSNFDYEKTLIDQLLYKIKPDAVTRVFTYRKIKRNRLTTIVDLTDAEWLMFQYEFSIYKDALEKDLGLFMSAFISKNHIYPSAEQTKDLENDAIDISEKYSKSELTKIAMMSNGIERAQINKSIGDGSKDE